MVIVAFQLSQLEFIREVELSRQSAHQERDAKKLFESGAQHPATLVEVMNKVNSPDELPLYYDGGVRVLADLLKDSMYICKIFKIFRVNDLCLKLRYLVGSFLWEIRE